MPSRSSSLKKSITSNIVIYFYSFISNNKLYIAIKWADKGDLKKLIKKFKKEGDQIDEVYVIEYVGEIASDFNICTIRE